MSRRETYEEIVRKADAEIASLERQIEDANGKVDAIMARGAGNLSPADRTEIQELNKDRKTLNAAVRRISLVKLEKLDKTDELQELVGSIRAVRADLEERRARIVRFARSAEEFGNALDRISDIATRIDGIREDISHLDDPAPKKKSG